jgi:hypothetical protein
MARNIGAAGWGRNDDELSVISCQLSGQERSLITDD